MTTRAVRVVAIIVALVGVGVGWIAAAPATAAPGAEITETGWWSRNPFADPPDRGFQVATAPDGPVSVSAIRIAIDGRVTKATLAINEAGGVPEAAALRVCAGPSGWNASEHAWASAPQADCAKTASMSRSAASGNFTADITTLLTATKGSQTVMIVPAAGAPAWQVDFSIAILSAEVEPVPTSSSGSSTGSSEPDASSAGSGAIATGSPSGSSSPGPSANAFDFAATPSFVAPAADPVGSEPTLDPGPAADVVDTAANPIAAPLPPARGASQPWGRLIIFIPLSALAGAAITFGRRFAFERLAR